MKTRPHASLCVSPATMSCCVLNRHSTPVFSQAYMWCAGPAVPTTLPAVLAQPWATVSAALHMPPVLVYATYNLMNWRRLDSSKPIELGNLAVQHVSVRTHTP